MRAIALTPYRTAAVLPPRLTVPQANEEYRQYMGDWWGDAIKAEWEERKADPL